MLFDKDAFREAVINAFAHNMWVNGDSPMFTAYEDRIEVVSLGTLPPGQTKEGFFSGVSIPVNKKALRDPPSASYQREERSRCSENC